MRNNLRRAKKFHGSTVIGPNVFGHVLRLEKKGGRSGRIRSGSASFVILKRLSLACIDQTRFFKFVLLELSYVQPNLISKCGVQNRHVMM